VIEASGVSSGRTTATAERLAVAVAYVVLAALLALTRLAGLDRSFWHDELFAVEAYVREGLGQILAGGVNHELHSLLAWAVGSAVGESEAAYRLLSVVPFLAGSALVTAWLHLRFGPPAGLVFLFLATVSPLLVDITRQARGYGLAWLAMSVLVVAAVETDRRPRPWLVVAMCAAGVAGTITLPHFAIAFVVAALALLARRELRRQVAIGLGISLLAVAAFYAPQLGDLTTSSEVEYGVQVPASWVLTAPVDQILVPAFLWIDGTVLVPGLVWLPVVGLAVLLMWPSPLLRAPAPATIVLAPPVATMVVFWAADLYSVPRYLSFLLVPLLVLVATGAGCALTRRRGHAHLAVSAVALVVLALVAARSAELVPDVVRLPREAHRDAAELVEERAPANARIYVYAHQPRGVAFYLDRPVVALEADEVAASVCGRPWPVAYVTQPFVVPPVDVPCLRAPGAVRHTFRQYTRGDRIDVWLVPAAAASSAG